MQMIQVVLKCLNTGGHIPKAMLQVLWEESQGAQRLPTMTGVWNSNAILKSLNIWLLFKNEVLLW